MKQKVFYSWQMDVCPEDNMRPISIAIAEACLNAKKTNSDFDYILDESTRDTPGSPNIPDTIFSKISKADIFIADITSANCSNNEKIKYPNSNVLIELGCAIADIGWDRIILLFNYRIL